MHAKCCSLDQKLNIQVQTVSGPTVKIISEQLTKWITSTQQWHFSELKLNCCGKKCSFQWSRNVTKLDSDVGIFCCLKIILTPVRVNSYCSFLLLLLFPHTTFCLVNPHCGLPSRYQQVSCATMLKCTRLVLCLAFPNIIYYSKWLGQIQKIIFFRKWWERIMEQLRGKSLGILLRVVEGL